MALSPSQRAARLELELDGIATLCEAYIRFHGAVTATGGNPPGVGLNHIEDLGKRIRHLQADIGLPVDEVVYRPGEEPRCPECGEILTGA